MRDRDALTVIMLHRVLPKAMVAALEADPGYTISTDVLERLASFLRANYTIVGLPEVLDARRGLRPLPSHPLLITFDDGWDDNVRHAAPVLAGLGVPWTLFVAAGAIGTGAPWWQETLLQALRTGRAPYRDLCAMAGTDKEPHDNSELVLLRAFGALEVGRRDSLLAQVNERKSCPDMASWDGLRSLGADVSIGVHGFSHLPLTMLDDPGQDLLQAREVLRSHLGPDAIVSMSFPHGRYDTKVLTATRALGFELIFTSDAVLNVCPGGWLAHDTIGRISVEESRVCDDRG
ncbi:MAG: polysaccharide deacetylase family protein, partial [Rhizobiales bacterium]|nr:polysaccharide deacetylase family protein [Hyphomicrobiales bacterium]